MRRRTVLAALAALPVAACASNQPDKTTMAAGMVRAEGVDRARPAAGAPIGAVTAGMISLGHRLCSRATGANWVASPLSIACAFAMVRAGARGTAAHALDEFFGYPAAGRDEAFNAITQALVTTSGSPSPRPTATPSPGAKPAAPVLTIGNALFAQRDFTLQQAFLRTLAAQYGAGVRTVDFAATAAALKTINQWVSAETAGRIPVLFGSLDPSTQLVVANTVYLRASWQNAFGESPTTRDLFTRTSGEPVAVAMMHAAGPRDYAAGPGWQALSLPYAGSGRDLAMWLILPDPGGRPVDMLTPETLSAVGAALRSRPVDVAVPKWNFDTSIDLGSVLPALGLTGVFGTGDFSGIATGIGGISAAVHKANITVDEAGTEAAAATGVAFASSGILAPTTFHANRPFAFTIVGGAAHTPLFTGMVADPSA
jgi:serpin B